MNTCSLPGCTAEAVLQWQRVGTDFEARAHSDLHIAQQIRMVDYRRAMLALEIQNLRTNREQLAENGGVNPRVLMSIDQMVIDKEADLDRIEDPAAPLTPPPVTVAVFGCADHAVDVDSAGQLHEAPCLTTGPCGCDLDATPPITPTTGASS